MFHRPRSRGWGRLFFFGIINKRNPLKFLEFLLYSVEKLCYSNGARKRANWPISFVLGYRPRQQLGETPTHYADHRAIYLKGGNYHDP